MSKGFQTSVSNQPAIGVAGDFADSNPYFTVPFGAGGAVAGASGVVVGRFAWAVPPDDADGAAATINPFGTGPVTGFVPREQQGLITTYLDDASMVIPKGFQLTLCNGGDFLVKNDGAAIALPGQKAYANFADGKITFAATGSPAAGATSSASAIVATTFSVTGQIVGNILTVSAVGSGTVVNGATISGTGITTGNMIASQISGAVGGQGQYYVTIGEQATASVTISGTYGVLTIGGTVVGSFGLNQVLAATGSVVAGTTITQILTGTGGSGSTLVVNNNTGVTSQAINVLATNVETKWIAQSTGLVGEIVKISDHANG